MDIMWLHHALKHDVGEVVGCGMTWLCFRICSYDM